MTIHVNIGEAKTRLSQLIAAALRGEDVYTIFADQAETQSFRQSLNEYWPELAPVLIQATCVGLLAALILSALISRSIARPLQDVAQAIQLRNLEGQYWR